MTVCHASVVQPMEEDSEMHTSHAFNLLFRLQLHNVAAACGQDPAHLQAYA